jgi:hypothetical protein
MAVHVGEMFTDIRPADPEQAAGGGDPGPAGGRTFEDLWEESRERSAWLRERTSAAGFDD